MVATVQTSNDFRGSSRFHLQDAEFQWFTNNRSNSFVKEGNLFIKPTLTVDEFGEPFLRSGVLNVHGGSPADQ